MEREEQKTEETYFQYLKRNLAWACASDLAPMSADTRTHMTDEVREKRMIDEMDRIMGRIRDARSEYEKAEKVFATNKPAIQEHVFTCRRCGNRNPDFVFSDSRSGDTICRGVRGDDNCGEVLGSHRVDMGAAHRNFSDSEEGDRNHHAPPANPFMPDSVNLRTTFNMADSSADKMMKISRAVEMGESNLGHDGRAATRTGYKTDQKNEAFKTMANWGDAMNIHEVRASLRAQESWPAMLSGRQEDRWIW